MGYIELQFEGFWQCRLATDPDPSDEQRGVSGFTYAIAGESLLEPSFWSQEKDILAKYGKKDLDYRDDLSKDYQGEEVKNIREASPDYKLYNENGISLKVTEVTVNGNPDQELTDSLKGALVRFENRPESNGPWKGPIFEGRNQITSDGDPDRFTLNPFVLSISKENRVLKPSEIDEELRKENPNLRINETKILERFDPLDEADPNQQLYEISPDLPNFNEIVERRLPVQRFAMSYELLDQVGIDPTKLQEHFTNRANWLKSKIAEAEAMDKNSLAEAYKSRLFAVNFFTQSTGPTVLENRLLSRIPLRQLYTHSIRGKNGINPNPYVDQQAFQYNQPKGAIKGYTIDTNRDWQIEYYLGAYDGDLMSGWSTGVLKLPYTVNE
ncbi:MAG: hypothetical protein N4A46_04170 [Schleiferiaceae bacterium]|jgi:hypothetical protein|nr:hypothetical protein [Schleiferiaceae bacterium]